MRGHLLQYDIAWEDADANFRTVERMLEDASPDEHDLVVLPEMFDSGFSLNHEITSDNEGKTLAFLRETADRFGVWLHGSRTIKHCHEAKARNVATVIGPEGEPVCEYAKVHPFSFGRESERFKGGRDIVSYTIASEQERVRVGCAICYDLRFPELFRALSSKDCEIFALGANWPSARQSHWRSLLIARAIENQAIVFGVNRCGDDPFLNYAGGTIAIDEKGEVLGELGSEPGCLSVEIDLKKARDWRGLFPALRDMRLPIGEPTD